MPQQGLDHDGGIARDAAAGIVPAIGEDHGSPGSSQRLCDRLLGFVMVGRAAARPPAEDFATEPLGQHPGFRIVPVGNDEHFRAHVVNVRSLEAVRYRNAEDTVAALQRLHAVDEASSRLAAGHEARDRAAIENRAYGLHLAPGSTKAKIDEVLRSLQKIRMRKFFERHDGVRRLHHLVGQVTMHIELGTDDGLVARNRARMGQQIAFAIIVTPRHHRTVKAEQHHIDWQCRFELIENFVSQALIRLTGHEARGLGPCGGSLDERETIRSGRREPRPWAQSIGSAFRDARREGNRRRI